MNTNQPAPVGAEESQARCATPPAPPLLQWVLHNAQAIEFKKYNSTPGAMEMAGKSFRRAFYARRHYMGGDDM